jgi:hypothetical protein
VSLLPVDLLLHHPVSVLHLAGSRCGWNAGCRYSRFFVRIARMARAALFAIAVAARRTGLSATIFAVRKSTFPGARFAIPARDVMPATRSLRQ